MLLVQQSVQIGLVDGDNGARRVRGRIPNAERLTSQRSLAEKFSGPEDRDDYLLARLRDHRELHLALPDVHDSAAGAALRIDRLSLSIRDNRLGDAGHIEKGFRVEMGECLGYHGPSWQGSGPLSVLKGTSR